jgi:S-adenosylmethionine uptake transporter
MSSERIDKPLVGIALAAAGYACFSVQDALVKWLVDDYQVPQILFMRSLVIVVIAGVLVRSRGHPSFLKSPYRGTLVLRAGLMLLAWLLFYNAARYLGLAELTTLYFSAPIITTILSILFLKEAVGASRWIACIGGFVGAVVAANPSHSPNLIPALMCVAAGFCWACSTVLVRMVNRTETTLTQMFATSLLFGLACAASFPWIWIWPDAAGWGLLVALGLVATIGQYLLYEGFRFAPASALAPVEYTGLIWAFLYGYIVWAEVPAANVFAGALLIVASSMLLVVWERRAEIAIGRKAREATGKAK